MDSNNPQTAVRVNPHHLIGATDEEKEVISTIQRPSSHALFHSKQIRFFGPIGIGAGAIPLRELLVGVGNRTGHGIQQDLDDGLPNPNSTTFFYCHYTGHPLDAKQFEVLWQFSKFTKEENVMGIDDKRKESIMTLWNRVQRPTTTFDKQARRYQYDNWTDEHFRAFFEEYCASKAAVAMMDPMKRDTACEWMTLRPPKPLMTAEWQAFVAEIGYPWRINSNEDCSKAIKGLKELLGVNQVQEMTAAVEDIPHGGEHVAVEQSKSQYMYHARNFRSRHGKLKEKKTGTGSGVKKPIQKQKPYGRHQVGKRNGARRGHTPPGVSPTASSNGDMYLLDVQEASDDSFEILI